MAEHLRSIIDNASFDAVGHITISIGVSMLRGNEHMESFIKRLDKALYRAKHEGRNRSVML